MLRPGRDKCAWYAIAVAGTNLFGAAGDTADLLRIALH
jgi:hypothetical protein